MPETEIFASEHRMERTAIADYLRTVADNLTRGEPISLRSGEEEEVTLEPPERPTFEVKAEREGPADGDGELSVEFELEWREGDDVSDGPLEIS